MDIPPFKYSSLEIPFGNTPGEVISILLSYMATLMFDLTSHVLCANSFAIASLNASLGINSFIRFRFVKIWFVTTLFNSKDYY